MTELPNRRYLIQGFKVPAELEALNLAAHELQRECMARVNDVGEQAAICALARGEREVLQSTVMSCPCGSVSVRFDFGPAGWLCGICERQVPPPWG